MRNTEQFYKDLKSIVDEYSMFFSKIQNYNEYEIEIFSYHYFNPDEFERCVRKYGARVCRELRGLTIVKKNGEIKSIFPSISKFFNLNENKFAKTYTDIPERIDLYEKIDGSLISPISVDGEILMKSKTSIYSDQARAATEILSDTQKEKILEFLSQGIYPQFEYVAPDNLIVVPYEKPELILIAVRYIEPNTGHFEYITDYDYLKQIAEAIGVRAINKYPNIPREKLLDMIENEKNIEGWILYWEDDYPFVKSKIKTQWYLKLHKFSPVNIKVKTLLEYVINETIDDILSSIDNNYLKEHIREKLSVIYGKIARDMKKIQKLREEFNSIGIREFGKKYGRKYKWLIGALKNNKSDWEILKMRYKSLLENKTENELKEYFGF
jgi:RNA ligase